MIRQRAEVAEALQAVQALSARVRPVALARDRVLPVHAALAPAFPEGGLRRGSVIGCRGSAVWSTALALCAAASQAGSWMAWVGCEPLGLSAAAEWGIALDRVLSIPEVPAEQQATVLAAVLDGVDLVVTRSAGVRAGDARRLGARLAQRGGALFVIGEPGAFAPDFVCSVDRSTWTGLGEGHGRLAARRVRFEVSGRRAERARRVDVWFPGRSGAVDVAVAGASERSAVTGLREVTELRTVADAVRSA